MADETKIPFDLEKAKAVFDNPYLKTANWLITKLGWVFLLWAVWSLKQYGHTYVAESPAVVEAKITAARIDTKVENLDKQAGKITDQQAQMQINQVAISNSLNDVTRNLNQLQTQQAVINVRVDGLERRANSAERTRPIQ